MRATALDTYSRSMGRHTQMDREEETELLKGWGTVRNRPAIRRRMIEGSLRFAVRVAMVMRAERGHIQLDDAVACANLGLVEAATRFRPDSGNRFITYAVHWIRQAVRNAQSECRLVRIPMNVLHDSGTIEAACDRLRSSLGRNPTDGEVVDALNDGEPRHVWTIKRLYRMQSSVRQGYDRLNEPSGLDGGPSACDMICDREAPMPDEEMDDRDVHQLWATVSAGLSERERMILERRYGLDGDDPAVLQDLGDTLGISRERVRQIEEDAREKIVRWHGKTVRAALGVAETRVA